MNPKTSWRKRWQDWRDRWRSPPTGTHAPPSATELDDLLDHPQRFAEAVLDNLPAMVFVKETRHLRFVHLNRAGEELLGLTRAQLLGRTDHDIFPAAQAQDFIDKDRQALAQGSALEVLDESITTPRGQRIVHTRKVPILGTDGHPDLLLGIAIDVTEQRQSERRILALNQALQRHAGLLQTSNQELEQFSYSVSHDLRAPLRAIHGYTSLLQQDYAAALDAPGRSHVRAILDASERMARLIDGLLEFSRLGRQQIQFEPVDMQALLDSALTDLLAQRTHLHPAFDIQPLLPASGDASMVLRVWLNLLDNALKYSAGNPHQRISVTAVQRDGQIQYSVHDNGVGFDMQQHEQLFGVFQRLHGTQQFPGTGVGLAIVQRIIQRHGGRIWAQSQPGEGATFHFTLPSAQQGGFASQ